MSEKSQNDHQRVAIILLNWNGKEDTLACLESLEKTGGKDFTVLLVDNASEDDTMESVRLRDFKNINIEYIQNSENFGFARANNIGIRYALEHSFGFVMLLNNDTVVSPDFLEKLLAYADLHPQTSVFTPQIRYFGRDERIWNCGGRLTSYGSKKYYFEDRYPSELKDLKELEVSFITGCALLIRSELLQRHGLLSERFFFGEEDYEFSLRMRELGQRMVCVIPSVIWHKVSSSVSRASDAVSGRIFIHYLNRFINLRSFMPAWKWLLWRRFYLSYLQLILILRYRVRPAAVLRFSSALMKESRRLGGVSKETFDRWFAHDFNKNINRR